MKVKAHLVVSKGYGVAITASQWISELQENVDCYHQDYLGESWRSRAPERVIVTVEFDVPETLFDPPSLPPVLQGEVVKED